LVVGAGVAGCATALELLSAGWRVGILHRHDNVSGTESLGPEVASRLGALSLGVGFPFPEVVAWWGSEQESRAVQPGGHIVERNALAGSLRAHAVRRGGTVIESAGHFSAERIHDRWDLGFELTPSRDRRLTARYLVDATGRASVIGRRLGSVRINCDDLLCVSASVFEPDLVGTWTESAPNGWWNLCCTREVGTLAFFSAAKTIREAKDDITAGLYDTHNLRHLLPTQRLGKTKVRPCGSSRMVPCAGPGWISVGDAASTLQPLASAGVSKAFRDAGMARRALEAGPVAYDRFQTAEFQSYLRQLRQQYALESRWLGSPFWTPTSSIMCV
jgi:flavin-dependent dehydrogenase